MFSDGALILAPISGTFRAHRNFGHIIVVGSAVADRFIHAHVSCYLRAMVGLLCGCCGAGLLWGGRGWWLWVCGDAAVREIAVALLQGCRGVAVWLLLGCCGNAVVLL